MNTLIILLAFLLSSLANAGLYECKNPEGEPTLVTENNKTATLKVSPESTYEAPYSKHPDLLKDYKKPFLIYYAIDTEEPFMQYSINYELAELRKACERSEHVNFVVFRNSEAIWGDYSYCKNKKFVEADFKDFPEMKEKFETKRKAIWEGDQSNVLSSPLKFVSRYSNDVKEIFYQYPLAHPDFLYDLMEFAVTKDHLFPSKEYTPFINLKSHGNVKTMLAGLSKCQVEAKKKSQEAILKKLDEGERMLLKNPLAYYLYSKAVNPILDKLALGANVAAKPGNTLGEYSLGEYSLGEYSLGEYSLSSVFGGLGVSQGLGAKFSFGTTQAGLSTVLNRLFNEKDVRLVGFVMLESCDTNRKVSVHQEHVPMVIGMYSAQSSLWYRNLNWWSLMEEANGDTEKLFDSVVDATKNIKNIVVK